MPRNLLADLPDATAAEVFTQLLARPGCRLEHIVSHGQATPSDHPWVGAGDEWVLLLAGAARLSMGGTETTLNPGDSLLIPAGTPHWVTFTAPDRPTVWLALHFDRRRPRTAPLPACAGPPSRTPRSPRTSP